MTRKRFFRKLAQTAALLALAPQLAFRVRPQPIRLTSIREALEHCQRFYILDQSALDLKALMAISYTIKKRRESQTDLIEFYVARPSWTPSDS